MSKHLIKSIELGSQEYRYTLRRPARSRQLRISVTASGALNVSAPRWVMSGVIEQFLRDQTAWVINQMERFRQTTSHPHAEERKREYVQHKATALKLALERLEHFNQHYGFMVAQVTIRNQKTRWGSCSRQGNLSFNYRIALLPPALADYVILHELCHLGAFDHSHRFWSLVERSMPDYAERRRELRRFGTSTLS